VLQIEEMSGGGHPGGESSDLGDGCPLNDDDNAPSDSIKQRRRFRTRSGWICVHCGVLLLLNYTTTWSACIQQAVSEDAVNW